MSDNKNPLNHLCYNTRKRVIAPTEDGAVLITKRGSVVREENWVREWRKKRRAYTKARKEMAALVASKEWSKEKVREFMTTPRKALGGRAPKQLMTPRSISVLLKWFRAYHQDIVL